MKESGGCFERDTCSEEELRDHKWALIECAADAVALYFCDESADASVAKAMRDLRDLLRAHGVEMRRR